MKKILFSLAAVAAMVGCAKDAPIVDNTNNTPEETLAISASIDLSDTRVTIEGEKFTDVKWEMLDEVRLVSVKGVDDAKLIATESGDTNVRFSSEAEYVADEDTYYAVYPSTTITNGVVSFDLTTQNGKAANAAILAATTNTTKKGVIDMAFKPINALLHVAVTGAPEIMRAEFLEFNGAEFASGFSYDFAADPENAVTLSGTTTMLTVNNPKNAEDFFFSLPADLDMSGGYIVRLTDEGGNVCSKAYNGKIFAKGTTTRVKFEWSQPTVTLGTPMTSYSYYVAGNVSQANSCTNNVIYFPNPSTYANVQNAMVAEAGIIVDNGDEPYTAVFANNSFTPANVTGLSWGEHSVKAYIKTKDGHVYESATQTVHITGLPYDANWFNSEDTTGWATTGTVKFNDNGYGYRTFKFYSSSETGAIFSPSFNLPNNVNVHYDVKAYFKTTAIGSNTCNLVTGITSGTTVPSSTQTKTINQKMNSVGQKPSESQYTTCSFDATMSNGQRVYITDSHPSLRWNGSTHYFIIGRCNVMYR